MTHWVIIEKATNRILERQQPPPHSLKRIQRSYVASVKRGYEGTLDDYMSVYKNDHENKMRLGLTQNAANLGFNPQQVDILKLTDAELETKKAADTVELRGIEKAKEEKEIKQRMESDAKDKAIKDMKREGKVFKHF